MRKNIIANAFQILFSLCFLLVVFLLDLNPLSLIISFILTMTNMLLAIYSMSLTAYPKIRIGKIEGSVFFCNLTSFLMQTLLIIAALSNSLGVSLVALFSVVVLIQGLMVFSKQLFHFLKFHITITLSVSCTTILLYCILLAYREFQFQVPATILAVLLIILYTILAVREKDMVKITSYSVLFSLSMILLSIGGFTAQGIYSAILYMVSFTPVMFMLVLASYSIRDIYSQRGVSKVTSVFVHLPVSGVIYFVGLLAILGFPPFSLFFGRLSVIQSAVTAGDYLRAGLMIVVIILSTYYVLARVMPVLFGGKEEAMLGARENTYHMGILMFLFVVSILLTVLIPGFIGNLISNARAYVLGTI